MKTPVENVSAKSVQSGTWYQTAVQTAVVGAVFSIIVLVLLGFNYIQRTVFDAGRTETLDKLKIDILSKPDDDALKSRIRELDLRVRQDRIRRWDFSRKGGYLLLGGLAVLLVGAKLAAMPRKKLPFPQVRADDRQRQLGEAMRARRAVTIGSAAFGAAALLLVFGTGPGFNQSAAGPQKIYKWPRFRGPGGLGVSDATNVPVQWNGKTGKGVLWKTRVPLPGHNSPVLWGQRVFLSGANENDRHVYCFDAFSGNLLWQRAVESVADANAEPLEPMEDTGYAAPTTVTDGRRVCAIFANGAVACFDVDGKPLWTKNLGVPENPYGYASSLAMYRHLLLIQYDQASAEDGKSKMMALNVFSGDPVWETRRDVSASWTSPIVATVSDQNQPPIVGDPTSRIVATVGDRGQLITVGDPCVIAYEPASGAELWRAECMGADLAPSPIYAGGFVFAIESSIKMVAIRPDGRGDVTETHIVWTVEDGIPDICSPVSNGQRIFLLTSDGTLTCYQVADGAKLWERDLGTYFSASPTLVGDRLYLLSEKGVMFIAEAAGEYEELTRCELGEDCHATPAFLDGRIYIRGLEHLYCIGTGGRKNP